MHNHKIASLSEAQKWVRNINLSISFTAPALVEITKCFILKIAIFLFKGLIFEVLDGGFNDIELKIMDQANQVIHEALEKSGRYTFGSGDAETTYTYCFMNHKGSQVPKVVMFTMDVHEAGRAPGAPNEGEVGHSKLEDMVNMNA